MFNQVILIGRIASDPELKESNTGKDYVELNLAIQRPFKNMQNQYETDYIKVVCWDYLAVNVSEYCKKGNVISVKGRLQPRTYKKNNETISTLEVIGDSIVFIGKPNEKKED